MSSILAGSQPDGSRLAVGATTIPLLRLARSLESADVPDDLSTRHDEYAVSGYPAPRVAEPDPDRPANDE